MWKCWKCSFTIHDTSDSRCRHRFLGLKYDFLLNFFHPLLAGAYRRRSSFSVVKLSGTQWHMLLKTTFDMRQQAPSTSSLPHCPPLSDTHGKCLTKVKDKRFESLRSQDGRKQAKIITGLGLVSWLTSPLLTPPVRSPPYTGIFMQKLNCWPAEVS